MPRRRARGERHVVAQGLVARGRVAEGPGHGLDAAAVDDGVEVAGRALEFAPCWPRGAGREEVGAGVVGRHVDRRRVAGLEYAQRSGRVCELDPAEDRAHGPVARHNGRRPRVVPHAFDQRRDPARLRNSVRLSSPPCPLFGSLWSSSTSPRGVSRIIPATASAVTVKPIAARTHSSRSSRLRCRDPERAVPRSGGAMRVRYGHGEPPGESLQTRRLRLPGASGSPSRRPPRIPPSAQAGSHGRAPRVRSAAATAPRRR